MQNDLLFAEGAVSIRAILSNKSREIHTIYTLKREKKPTRHAPKPADVVLELARSRGIPIVEADEDFFNLHAEGKTHGNLLAHIGERTLLPAEALVDMPNAFLAYLVGIEDPYNFASCLRTLYAAGCSGVFLPERNWLSAGSVILRASAGASEALPMAIAPKDPDEFLTLLASKNITPVCARESRAQNLYTTRLPRPICLLIGGERRGIDKTLDEKIDRGIIIPYGRNCRNSLSAHAACAVIAFEILRQQNEEQHTWTSSDF